MPASVDGTELDEVGPATFSDLCRFVAQGVRSEEMTKSVAGGVDFAFLPAVKALILLITAAKNLLDLYERLAKKVARKPTREEFERETLSEPDRVLVVIVFNEASKRVT